MRRGEARVRGGGHLCSRRFAELQLARGRSDVAVMFLLDIPRVSTEESTLPEEFVTI